MTLDQILQLLSIYQYLILFPISIVEGPIVTVIAGFLTTLGVMKVVYVYLIVIMGDVLGDIMAYCVGRAGGSGFNKIFLFFNVTPKKLEDAKNFFNTHHNKAIILSKVFYGIGTAGLIGAGVLKIPYQRYLATCFLVSVIQSAILLVTGLVFGHLYVQISKYFDYLIAGALVIALASIIVLILYKTKGLGILGK